MQPDIFLTDCTKKNGYPCPKNRKLSNKNNVAGKEFCLRTARTDVYKRQGLNPSAVVLVATVRALKYHGGVAKADLNAPNVEAVRKGSVNLARHIDNLKNGFGLPVCVAINSFPTRCV